MTPSHGSILLADDEEKILKRLGRALRDEGHEVVEATSVREAQRHLTERPFDLLVVDNLMPGVTGLELVRELSLQPAQTCCCTTAKAVQQPRRFRMRSGANSAS